MNNERILRITNYFLQFGGYQLHWYDSKTRRYQLNLLGLVNFILLTVFYIICVSQHFAQSALLKVIRDVSPFMWRLIRLQLLVGLKVYAFWLYELCRGQSAANGLAQLLPRVFAHKLSWHEAYAYLLLLSTPLLSLGFVLYIAYELEFKLPPWDNILVSLALFIPHHLIAGALKYYNIGCWLLREQLQRLRAELLEQLLTYGEKPATPQDTTIEMLPRTTQACAALPCNGEVQKSLQQCSVHLEQVAAQQQLLNAALGKQLALLLLMNSSSLLAGVYMRVYFETTWHLLFTPTWTRIHYASNVAIFVLIGWDYLCLCLNAALYDRVKSCLYENVCAALQRRGALPKELRHHLKAMRKTLRAKVNLQFFNVFRVDLWHFLALHISLGIVIALIVSYHHLNDQIVAIVERLDSANDDDD